MSHELKVPVLPESVSEATVLTWHKQPGDTIRRDENLLDLETEKFDLIFADPPYDLPQLNMIASHVFKRDLLNPEGYLIIEHPSMKKLDNDQHFIEQRTYGSCSFSFFGHKEQ